MVDELERLRELRDGAPSPARSWVDDTRGQLLAMADDEVRHADQHAQAEPSPFGRSADRLLTAFRRPAVAAAAALLLVGAVGVGVWRLTDDDTSGRPLAQPDATEATAPEPTSSPTSPPSEPGTQLAATCSAPDGTYTVAYPDGWHTNPGETVDACQVFDPQPIDLEEGIGGGPFGAITVRALSAPFDVVREPGRSGRLLSSEPTTVEGRDAVRQTVEHTGDGAIPQGTRSYRYLIDLGDRTLLAVTYDFDEASFDERRQIVDRMVRSLELGPTGSSDVR